MFGEYEIIWDKPLKRIPATEKELSWDAMTGTCQKTGHRVKVWDRHTAFRAPLSSNLCPDERNWIAMPAGTKKLEIRELWDQMCPRNKAML
jgi:hypothetical protein